MKLGRSGSQSEGLRALIAATLTLVLSVPLATDLRAAVVVQQEPGGRHRVLVVPLNCRELDRRFGDKVAEVVRKELEEFSTHAPIEKREYERALKRYEVKEEELNPIKSRQLANLMGAQVAFVGSCVAAGGAYDLQAGFISVATGDEVKVPQMSISDKGDDSVDRVARASIAAFQEQVRFERARQFCADYVGSSQPENALRNCNEALAINSSSVPTLLNKGLAFRQLFEGEQAGTNGWADSAVVYFEKVLEIDPGRREALSQAAYILSQVGNAERASELYKQYLELDPANVPVRLKVADDMAKVGYMAEAIEIIQAGLQYVENDVTLLQFLGDYALNYSSEDSSYVDIALESYEKILELKGEETDQRIIMNALAAYTAANRTAEAIAFAEKALESASDNPRLWSLYADALGRSERHSDAAAAMDRVIELDPAYQNALLKRGSFKLQAGDKAGATADFNQAISSGNSSQDDVYLLFYRQAIEARNANQFREALGYFEDASNFAPAGKKTEVEFWWAYTNYQLGERIADNDDANLSQLQSAQSYFQSAQTHFARAGGYHQQIPALQDATGKWLLNIEARIKQIQRGS